MADEFAFGAEFEEPIQPLETASFETDVKELQSELNRVQALTLKSGDITFEVRNSNAMSISASATVSITTITNGYNGQLLILLFSDSNVTFVHDASGAKNTINLKGTDITSVANGVIMLVSDGTSWKLAYATGSNIQTFDSSGTWTKPAFGTTTIIECWGGGGSGGKGQAGTPGAGGGGGGYTSRIILLSSLGATETVTIGDGGVAQTTASTNGNVGGNTTLGSWLTAYGGGAGERDSASKGSGGGGGGGALGVGLVGATRVGGRGGSPSSSVAGAIGAGGAEINPGQPNSGGGGGGGGGDDNLGGTAGVGGAAVEGGGGGGGGSASTTPGAGGASLYGGGGGGGGADDTAGGAGGISAAGGAGGAGAIDAANATVGTQPSGGGGGSETGTSGAGGKGRCRVTTF